MRALMRVTITLNSVLNILVLALVLVASAKQTAEESSLLLSTEPANTRAHAQAQDGAVHHVTRASACAQITRAKSRAWDDREHDRRTDGRERGAREHMQAPLR